MGGGGAQTLFRIQGYIWAYDVLWLSSLGFRDIAPKMENQMEKKNGIEAVISVVYGCLYIYIYIYIKPLKRTKGNHYSIMSFKVHFCMNCCIAVLITDGF